MDFESGHARTRYTDEQMRRLHDKAYFGHTKYELRTFLDKHGAPYLKSEGKGELARRIAHHFAYGGIEYELALSAVLTPSSYVASKEK